MRPAIPPSRHPEDASLVGFDHSVRAWGRGSEYVHLTPEQYGKLQVRGEALRVPGTAYLAIQRPGLSFNLPLTDRPGAVMHMRQDTDAKPTES